MALAVEVISNSERAKDIANKTEWYATAGVALLLTMDPRTGAWTLHSHPRDGAYQGVLHGTYGEDIPSARSPIDCSTDGWPATLRLT